MKVMMAAMAAATTAKIRMVTIILSVTVTVLTVTVLRVRCYLNGEGNESHLRSAPLCWSHPVVAHRGVKRRRRRHFIR